jgi:drug/metabolite transporter (DMT)-like permease
MRLASLCCFGDKQAMTVRAFFRQNGLALLVAGSAVDSTSGLLTRLTASDGFTTASCRGFIAFLFLVILLVRRDGSRSLRTLLNVGVWGLAFVALNASGMVMNILSLKFTAVANFFMIFAAAPFAAAMAGRLVLKERLDTPTLLTSLAGFAGVAVMMISGARSDGLAGDLLAAACVITYSVIVLVVRRNPHMDMLPTLCLTVLLSGLIGLPFASVSGLEATDWAVLAALGVIQLAGGNLMIFNAVRRIPAAQSGLLGILNAAFAPIWVLLFLGEVPPFATLVGGAIVLAAAASHLLWMTFKLRPQRPAPL